MMNRSEEQMTSISLRPTFRVRLLAAAARRLGRYGLLPASVLSPLPADSVEVVAAEQTRVYAVAALASATHLRGRFRLTLNGPRLAGASARIDFLALKQSRMEILNAEYYGLNPKADLYGAGFVTYGDTLACDVLLTAEVSLTFTHIVVTAGTETAEFIPVLGVAKIAPFLHPALTPEPTPADSQAVARILDFRNMATAKAVKPVVPPEGAPRIAAIVPRDVLEDLSVEPVALVALDMSPNTVEFEPSSHDLLLIVPDGQRYDGAWQSEFMAPRPDSTLGRVVAAAKGAKLPVVLWYMGNRADDAGLKWLEERADLVCRTDPAARGITHGEDGGVVCPPLFQPRLFNPFVDSADVAIADQSETDIFLDGWWNAADTLQDSAAAIALKPGLSIVDSAWEHASARQADSGPFRRNSLGCISQIERALVTKFWRKELFVADQTLSLATLRKRAREAIGANCRPVSFEAGLHADLLDGLLPHRLPALDDEADDETILDMLHRRAEIHLARRRLLETATYHHLISEVSQLAGREPTNTAPPMVSIILVTRRPQFADACLAKVKAQTYPNLEFIYVLHGQHADADAVLEKMREGGAIALQFDTRFSLGACINAATRNASGEFVAKMDDDDFYGPNYIADLMGYRRCVDFDFIGKPHGFFYFAGEDGLHFDRTAFRREWKYSGSDTGRVLAAGAATMVKRGVLETIRYPESRRGGADLAFSRRCQEAGVVTYSADVFNFVVYRSSDPGLHTWNMTGNQTRSLIDVAGHFDLAGVML